jgi:hypothetical protein
MHQSRVVKQSEQPPLNTQHINSRPGGFAMATKILGGFVMSDRATFWLKVIKELGYPIAVSFILALSCWSAGSWVATNVFQPLVSRHIKFLDAAEDSARAATKAAETNAAAARDLASSLGDLAEGQEEVVEMLRQTTNAIKANQYTDSP